MKPPLDIALGLLCAALVLTYPVGKAVEHLQHWVTRKRKPAEAALIAEWALDPGDLDETRCARCQLPREQALGLPCSCETDCDADHCLAFANAEVTR